MTATAKWDWKLCDHWFWMLRKESVTLWRPIFRSVYDCFGQNSVRVIFTLLSQNHSYFNNCCWTQPSYRFSRCLVRLLNTIMWILRNWVPGGTDTTLCIVDVRGESVVFSLWWISSRCTFRAVWDGTRDHCPYTWNAMNRLEDRLQVCEHQHKDYINVYIKREATYV